MAKSKALSADQKDSLVKCIEANDFKWWMERRLIAGAKDVAAKQLGFEITASAFAAARKSASLDWWKIERRPKPSSSKYFGATEWDTLAAAVRRNAEFLADKTIDEAVAIVSLNIRCNTSLLEGLRQSLHVWKKST